MCAAALAEGLTVIESAACEPEVQDVADLLISMGAHIQGAGTPRIVIEGVRELRGTTHDVIPDRIEAGTYMMASAITNGRVTIENCPIDDLLAASEHLRTVGVRVAAKDAAGAARRVRASVEVTSERRLHPTQVTTQPHPGFPTDLQAQIMALLSLADGNSIITERIYPQRFLHVAELSRMGAQIFQQNGTAVVTGVRELVGAPVMASDLRASASLVLAGLAAQGTTTVLRVYHLDRGYERMENTLRTLGAHIERVDEKDLPASGRQSD
jgi:UDP-N-acetylglucosamine 1-carboxyvinyltransferase